MRWFLLHGIPFGVYLSADLSKIASIYRQSTRNNLLDDEHKCIAVSGCYLGHSVTFSQLMWCLRVKQKSSAWMKHILIGITNRNQTIHAEHVVSSTFICLRVSFSFILHSIASLFTGFELFSSPFLVRTQLLFVCQFILEFNMLE